jgi:hypothetical protein
MNQCTARTVKGVQCKNRYSNDSQFCALHIRRNEHIHVTTINDPQEQKQYSRRPPLREGEQLPPARATRRIPNNGGPNRARIIRIESVEDLQDLLILLENVNRSERKENPFAETKPKPVISDPIVKKKVDEIEECTKTAMKCMNEMMGCTDPEKCVILFTVFESANERVEQLAFEKVTYDEAKDCPVCLGNVNIFVNLLCNHSICVDCVNKSLDSTKGRCVLCKRNVFTLREQDN